MNSLLMDYGFLCLQEMASRGLSIVYQLGDEAARAELLKSLMGTLQGATFIARLFVA